MPRAQSPATVYRSTKYPELPNRRKLFGARMVLTRVQHETASRTQGALSGRGGGTLVRARHHPHLKSLRSGGPRARGVPRSRIRPRCSWKSRVRWCLPESKIS